MTTPAAPGSSWRDIDLRDTVAAIVRGELPDDAPDLVRIDGGGCLLYPGKVHSIHGLGGAGKTWVAAFAIAQILSGDDAAMFIDLEDRPRTIVDRLLTLGVTAQQITSGLHYKRPHDPLDDAGLAELYATVEQHRPRLAIIDSVGEALALDGINPNADEEVAGWVRRAARGLADRGPAVLMLDHVPKSDEKSLMPIGSQRKQAAVDGIVFSLQLVTPFSREKPGLAKIVCGKDRAGHYARGQVIAELHVAPHAGESLISLRAPAPAPRSADGSFRPTVVMEKLSRALESADRPLSARALREAVGGNHETRDLALRQLVDDGFVKSAPAGSGHRYTLVKMYRADDDADYQSAPLTLLDLVGDDATAVREQ